MTTDPGAWHPRCAKGHFVALERFPRWKAPEDMDDACEANCRFDDDLSQEQAESLSYEDDLGHELALDAYEEASWPDPA